MRLHSSSTIAVTAILLMLSSSTSSFPISAEKSLLLSHSQLQIAPQEISSDHQFSKRAEDHSDHSQGDHDHDDHATPVPSTTASVTGPSATPSHDQHTHSDDHSDHDHSPESKVEGDNHAGHSHSESEAGHSHGPARTCEPHDHSHGEYVVWHHIVALLVLMVVAGLGCSLPMMIKDGDRTRFMIQLGKYFGAGVVLSVAFVHILPEALFSLTHPCLSKTWTDDYPGFAPLIMMVSGLTMLVIEFLASQMAFKLEAQNKKTAVTAETDPRTTPHHHHDHDHKHSHVAIAPSHPLDCSEPSSPSSTIAPAAAAAAADKPASHGNEGGCSHAHGLTLLQCGPGVSAKVSTYMLEVGIALHSVFIGIALGVLAGSEFLAMTIAICFHQFFEGVALGSRIADLTFPGKRWLPILLIAIFALVTPLGVAIGMGMHTSYKSTSVENLIIQGVTNSIACGVLLYTAFVTLLGGDILYSERFRAETRASKASYLVAVWMGALSMAVIALWA
ncbi:hypothetical protein BGZ83_000506 [Gryganskiella cystojenkinii]|nr:hypothetical protein BGZ83_000506 [Gryganskiella cystojenkinii]